MPSEFFRDTAERQVNRFIRGLPIATASVPLGIVDTLLNDLEAMVDDELSASQATIDDLLSKLEAAENTVAELTAAAEELKSASVEEGRKRGLVEGVAETAARLRRPENEKRTGKTLARDLEKIVAESTPELG